MLFYCSLIFVWVDSCDKQYEANFKSLRIEEEDNFVVDVKRSQNECGVIPGLLVKSNMISVSLFAIHKIIQKSIIHT